ncbi:MAG TPA: ABC transporter permease [Marmoricola sp.]|jgi:peptide/nickel transport system permease protein
MRYLLHRLGFFVLTLWAAVTVNFAIPRLMPGDPASAMMARFHGRVNPAAIHALEVAFGVNSHQSLWSQYLSYLHNTVTGNFGVSLTYFPLPVSTEIAQAVPWTLGLVGVATVLAFVVGTLVGAVSGWKRGGLVDSVVPPVFVVTSALPYFWVGMILILFFSVMTNGLLPNDGAYDVNLVPSLSPVFIGDVVRHALLPAATILITSIGGWILTMRNNMVTVLAEDYVRMGRAKGLSDRRIMYQYAARNALLPNLAGFAMSLGFVVAGAILVEYVFNYPGLGYMLLNAVNNLDYPLMQALFLMITVAVLVAVLLCDFVTALLDPRTRSS